MPEAALLFAAGFGTRMGALTRDRPKPLIQVAGRALLDHALDIAADVPRRVVNAHYKADQIADHLRGRPVALSIEAPEILDTGGGLRAALPLLGPGPVYTLNTDAVWRGPNPLAQLRSAWDPARMRALLLCVPLAQARGRQGGGDCTLAPDGRLTWGGGLVYTGAQIVATDGLDRMQAGAFPMRQIWDAAAEGGGLHGIVYPGLWADVGHPDGIAVAEAMLHDA